MSEPHEFSETALTFIRRAEKSLKDRTDFAAGEYLCDLEAAGWLPTPFLVTRDTNEWDFEYINLNYVKESLDSEQYEIVGIRHWAVGWVDILYVGPYPEAIERVAELAEHVAEQYPILDEEAHSEAESAESWRTICEDLHYHVEDSWAETGSAFSIDSLLDNLEALLPDIHEWVAGEIHEHGNVSDYEIIEEPTG